MTKKPKPLQTEGLEFLARRYDIALERVCVHCKAPHQARGYRLTKKWFAVDFGTCAPMRQQRLESLITCAPVSKRDREELKEIYHTLIGHP